jgi:hypothetical protein
MKSLPGDAVASWPAMDDGLSPFGDETGGHVTSYTSFLIASRNDLRDFTGCR